MSENQDKAMEALFEALRESGQLEEFLENSRKIEEAAQAAVLGMHSDPATEEGRRAIEAGAEAGDLTCQLKIAIIYGEGELVPADPRKSLYFFEKAANENHDPTAQYYAAQYYAAQYYAGVIDDSIPKNLDKAIDYLRLAVKGKDKDIAEESQVLLDDILNFKSLLIKEEMEKRQQIEKEKGGCYIATAVYGSYDCPEVWVLRRFRDQVLAGHLLGRSFIRCYYAISPMLVRAFGKKTGFIRFFRKKLDALVSALKARGIEDTHYQD